MKRSIILMLFSAFLYSCNSNEDALMQEPETDNFYALTVGNSWVYKNYKFNVNTNNYEDTGVIDSVSIVGTEDYNGKTYYNFRRMTTGNETNITYCNPNGEYFELLRDSLGYLVRNDSYIKFTNGDYEERELSSVGDIVIYEILMNGISDFTVEAGTFECIHSERYARDANNVQMPGLDKIYYSDGFGLIYDTNSFVSESIPSIIRKLDTYEVN